MPQWCFSFMCQFPCQPMHNAFCLITFINKSKRFDHNYLFQRYKRAQKVNTYSCWSSWITQPFTFVGIPIAFLSKGSRVREPALRRRNCVPAKWFFASCGSAGGFGKTLIWSSSLHRTGSFGFCQQRDTLAANPGANTAPKHFTVLNRKVLLRCTNILNM